MSENHFKRLWALGYTRLCPITPPKCPVSERSSFHRRIAAGDDARGKAPGVRWPDGNWSGVDFVTHESTEADLDKWHAMGAGVGIKLGRGLALIDADTKNKDLAKIIMDTVERVLGVIPPVRVGNYPKAGYLVRTDADFRYCRIEFGERDDKGRLRDRVEILSEGRQFVAHGIHPDTMKPYHWPKGMPHIDEVPFVSADTLHALLEALRPLLPAASALVQEGAVTDVNQDSLKGDLELIRKAVRLTPNTSDLFPTREAYLHYGYAIKAATVDDPEIGLELYQDWCARWVDGENDPLAVEAEWARMKPPFRRGANWIYELAEQHAPAGQFSQAERWFEEPDNSAPLFPEISENAFAVGKLFEFTPFDRAAETALTAASAPLIKGLMDQGAMTVLYGESNTGKTFIAMDVAYHIAGGLEWAGMRTTRFAVLYVAAEGGQGARKRAAALKAKYGANADFYFLLHPINLLRADADLPRLLASIRAIGVTFGLVVVDTLSRAMAGGDENSSTDMGAMVKHLDALRAATSAHLMVVHHSGKDRAKGARGHSLLRAATDTEIEISDGEIVVTKQRDLDKSFSSGFVLDVVTLGVDGDGDPVTSCTIRLVSVDEARGVVAGQVSLTQREGEIAEAVSQLSAFSEGENEGVSVGEVVQFFADREDNMSENAVRTMLKKLVAKGILGKNGRGKWKMTDFGINQSGPESSPSVFS